MSIPVATALGTRDRSWPAILASAAVHAAVIVWALTAASRPEIELHQKPIVAKLVRLGQKRPPELLPRKSAEDPPPAPVAAPPAPAPAPPVASAPPAPAARPVPAAKPAPAPKPVAAAHPVPAARPAPAAAARAPGASVSSILAGARQTQERERWGAPDGDPMGDSDTAADGDRYLASIVQALRQNYAVPEMLSDRERLALEAKVVLYIESDGRVSHWNVESPSGNGLFDGALERTLTRTRRVPPPPEGSRDQYRRGIVVIFTPRTLG